MREQFFSLTTWLPQGLQITLWVMTKIIAILAPLMLCVAYFTFAERKLIAYMQIPGSGRTGLGPKGGYSRLRMRSN